MRSPEGDGMEIFMELLQLKYFCDAAVSENFSLTAKKFDVPPSNISQSVKRLEKELGVNLFSRRANRIFLNETGKKFYKKISSALTILSDAVMEATDDANSGKIKICINSNRRIVMRAIEKYRRVYPDVEIITSHFVDPALDSFDVIVDSDDSGFLDYEKRLMISEKIMVAVIKGSKYADIQTINISDLSDEVFVTMKEKTSLYKLTKSICDDFGFKPRIAVQSDDPFYVRKCIEAGLGISFVPSFSWKGQFSDNVILKEVEGYTRDTYIYTDMKKHLPICAKRFIETLLEECCHEK